MSTEQINRLQAAAAAGGRARGDWPPADPASEQDRAWAARIAALIEQEHETAAALGCAHPDDEESKP